jgi:SpoVK/Ycf46/Vps4 family AAA+-type ATPase
MDEWFANPSQRIFALYGNTGDRFITPQLRELSLEQWLLCHLRSLGYQRIIYYSPRKKIHFIDSASAQRLRQTSKSDSAKTVRTKPSARKTIGGPMNHDRLRRDGMPPATQSDTKPKGEENIRWDMGGMSDSDAIGALNRWMCESEMPTALVFRNGEDLFHRLDEDAVRLWDDVLSTWSAANLPIASKNIAIVLFSGETIAINNRLPKLHNLLMSTVNEADTPRTERCFLVGSAKPDEVRDFLHRMRLRGELDWTPLQIQQRAVALAQSLIPEDLSQSVKKLVDLFHMLKQARHSAHQANAWQELQALDGLGDRFAPRLRTLVDEAKRKLSRHGPVQEVLRDHQIARLRPCPAVATDKLANLHLALLGNPGTGKTILARLIARVYRDEGLLESGHLVEVDRKDLVAGFVGQTALRTGAAIERAMGGILFIDEAYALAEGGDNDFGQEAIDTLLKAMSDYNGRFAVIIAGYTQQINDFIEGPDANPGLQSRFPEANRWQLEDYPPEVLYRIFCRLLEQEDCRLDADLIARLPAAFEQWHKARDPRSFGNARAVKNLIQALCARAAGQAAITEAMFARLQEWSQYLGLHELPSPEDLLQPLDNLVGLENIRAKLSQLCHTLLLSQRRTGSLAGHAPGHYVFTGNPGTGKTTVARLMGEMFHRLGVLQKGHVEEVTAKNLIGQHVGSAEKNIADALRRAHHGVLFIDEAYQLTQNDNPFGRQAAEALVAALENQRQHLCVIVAGYPEEMAQFVDSNAGFASRFNDPISFDDYTPPQLLVIALRLLKEKSLQLSPQAEDSLLRLFAYHYANRKTGFGNARFVRKLLDEQIIPRQATRLSALTDAKGADLQLIEAVDLPVPEGYRPQDWGDAGNQQATLDPERVLQDFGHLVGLPEVKQQVRDLAARLALQKRRGFGSTQPGHYVFTGNPGTGKTAVARLMGRVFRALGLLAKGHVVEVRREDLVGAYVGHSERDTKAKIEQALDGILFIDEAYQLTRDGQDSFGKSAVETLLASMENHRDRLCVIVAGYPREMQQFIASNPGFPSRFTQTLHFADYDADALLQIALGMFGEQHYELSEAALKALQALLRSWDSQRGPAFGNARDVRKLLGTIITNQSRRLGPLMASTANDAMLSLIECEDIPLPSNSV